MDQFQNKLPLKLNKMRTGVMAHVCVRAVAKYVCSFCHHRTLATLTAVGSLVHHVSVNTQWTNG